jgi:hypothetical protein
MSIPQDRGKFRKNLQDAFYTKPEIAAHCVELLLGRCEVARATDAVWLEPAAGAGAFLGAFPAGCTRFALDIAPAPPAAGIERADFMTWDLPAEAGGKSLIVCGNPPFGRQGSAARAFIGRAAALGAAVIAFILPRSFMKPSMQAAFPATYHCVVSEELPAESFTVNGESYAVPCVFQVWERRAVPRVVETAVRECGFAYVRGGGAGAGEAGAGAEQTWDIAVRRVGVYAGRTTVASADAAQPSVQSHYFIRLDDRVRAAAGVIASRLSAHTFPTNTTGPRSISKGELNAVLNALVADIH